MRPAPREKHLVSSRFKNWPKKLITVKKYIRKNKKLLFLNMHRMDHFKNRKTWIIYNKSLTSLYYSVIPADDTDSVVTAIAKIRFYSVGRFSCTFWSAHYQSFAHPSRPWSLLQSLTLLRILLLTSFGHFPQAPVSLHNHLFEQLWN